jgi:hypothetical protein
MMENFILSLLVFVMLTPGLACAQFMGHQKPFMAKEMPCRPDHEKSPDVGAAFFKDCAKIDLQHADNAPLLKKPDIAKVFFPFVYAQRLGNSLSSVGLAIRGPPLGRLSASETHPPILLYSQRLRI